MRDCFTISQSRAVTVLASLFFAGAAFALVPGRALACGGGGGGGGGGGHHCTEVSDVVGFQHCSHFGGAWDVTGMPALAFEAGLSTHAIAGADLVGTGSSTHHGNTLGLVVGGAGTGIVESLDLRARWFVLPYLYLGAELSFGMGPTAPGTSLSVSGMPDSDGLGPVMLFGGGITGGIRVPLGPIDFRADLLLGGELVGTDVQTALGKCTNDTMVGSGIGLVEPRIAVDYWITPWLSVGVGGGVNAVGAQEDVQVGVMAAFHTRSRDFG